MGGSITFTSGAVSSTVDALCVQAPAVHASVSKAPVNSTFWNGLYSGDGSHPSAWGTYLNACVFYATILKKSPVGLDYYSSIGETDAVVLQQLAEDIVLDSLSSWNIGHADVIADANFVNEGGSGLVDFSNRQLNREIDRLISAKSFGYIDKKYQCFIRANKILAKLEKNNKNAEVKDVLKQTQEEEMQLSFFQLDDPLLENIKEEILATNIDTLTPIEALMKLNEIKRMLIKK